MKTADLIQHINNVSWDDIKKLSHVNNRIYYNDIVEKKDAETKTTGRLYLTLFSEPNEKGKDRYFGSQTTSTVASFMESNYAGSIDEQAFHDAMNKKDCRVICLKVGQDSSILVEEEKVLKAVDAKENILFFNESNISGTKLKTLGIQEELFDKITDNIENKVYRTKKETVENLVKTPRAQPRQFDFDFTHSNNIAKDLEDSKGKAIENIRPTILLENFHGPGKHQRGGNTHTIDACDRDNVKKYVKKLKVIFVPESDWSRCTPKTLRDILRWDNRKQQEITQKNTDDEEIIESCVDLCVDFGLDHIDERVKKRARKLGAASATDWDRIRPKLRDRVNEKKSDNEVPPNMERILYTDGMINDIQKSDSDDHDIKVISTVYTANGFNGWDFLVRWVTDPANKKRTLHTPFMHGKNSIKKYADAWPDKQKDLTPIIENLFKTYGKKGHWTWDVLDRLQPKKNKVTVKKLS
jgi:hypothetical protein